MDASKYNMITEDTLVKPCYDLSKYPSKIRVVFRRSGNVLILGMVNDYVFFAAYTDVEDTEINAAVFNEIARRDLSRISDEYELVPKVGIDRGDYRFYFSADITPRKDGGFDTPFGHIYPDDGGECGSRFASDLKSCFTRMRELCKARERDGLSEEVLSKHLKELEKLTWEDYGLKDRAIRDMIKDERYLALSDNDAIRELYLKCAGKLYSIYCEYMSRTR